jgi:hypothetical protein
LDTFISFSFQFLDTALLLLVLLTQLVDYRTLHLHILCITTADAATYSINGLACCTNAAGYAAGQIVKRLAVAFSQTFNASYPFVKHR